MKRSRHDKLLQNYLQNPFLLSLIVEYYRDIEEPLATRLNEVFEKVLERELGKPASAHEVQYEQSRRIGLRKYISNLLAPYCFLRVVGSVDRTNDDVGHTNFMTYLKSDPRLSPLLFDSDEFMGYLRALHSKHPDIREKMYHQLALLWGEERVDAFRSHLYKLMQEGTPYKTFEGQAIAYLYGDLMDLLKQSNLAEIDYECSVVKRFRHRRMQDYFMALFVDTVGVTGKHWDQVPIANAWMREPLRIIGAITGNPEALVTTFRDEYDRCKATTPSAESLNSLANLMVNASETIAYLPVPKVNPLSNFEMWSVKLVAEL